MYEAGFCGDRDTLCFSLPRSDGHCSLKVDPLDPVLLASPPSTDADVGGICTDLFDGSIVCLYCLSYIDNISVNKKSNF